MTIKWLPEHINTITIHSMERCCVNCRHFMQHYIHDDVPHMHVSEYTPISIGHCTYPRIKDRRVEQSCQNFTPRHQGE